MGVCCAKKKDSTRIGQLGSTGNILKQARSSSYKQQARKHPFYSQNTSQSELSFTDDHPRSTELNNVLVLNNCIIQNKNTHLHSNQQHRSQTTTTAEQSQPGNYSTLAQVILSKYDYYNDVDPMSDDAHQKILNIEKQKREHHVVLLTMLSYLNLKEIITIARINRKLYIVSGDFSLLRNFVKANNRFEFIIRSNNNYDHQGYVYSVIDHRRNQIVRQNYDGDPNQSREVHRSNSSAADYKGQFDIILDKTTPSGVELQNQMFRLQASKRNSMLSNGSSNITANKTILIQDFDEIGSNGGGQIESGFNNLAAVVDNNNGVGGFSSLLDGGFNHMVEQEPDDFGFFGQERRISFSLRKRPDDYQPQQQLQVIQTENLQYKKQRTTSNNNANNPESKVSRHSKNQQSQDSVHRVNVYGAESYFKKINLSQIQRSRFATQNNENTSQPSQRQSQEGIFSQRTPSFVRRLRESAISAGTHNSLMIINGGGQCRISNHIFQSQESEYNVLAGMNAGGGTSGGSNKHSIQLKNDSFKQGTSGPNTKISVNDYLNIQLGSNAVLMVQTPGGTKATIMPLSSKGSKPVDIDNSTYVQQNEIIEKYFKSEEATTQAKNAKKITIVE